MILGELTNALVHLESHRSEAVAFLGDMSDAGKCEVICEQAGSVEEVARIVAHIRRKVATGSHSVAGRQRLCSR